jgi:hypothetical protein
MNSLFLYRLKTSFSILQNYKRRALTFSVVEIRLAGVVLTIGQTLLISWVPASHIQRRGHCVLLNVNSVAPQVN